MQIEGRVSGTQHELDDPLLFSDALRKCSLVRHNDGWLFHEPLDRAMVEAMVVHV